MPVPSQFVSLPQKFQGPTENNRNLDNSGRPNYFPVPNNPYSSVGTAYPPSSLRDDPFTGQSWSTAYENAVKQYAGVDRLQPGQNPSDRVETERFILPNAWDLEGHEIIEAVIISRLLDPDLWATKCCPYTKAYSTQGLRFVSYIYNDSFLARVPYEGVSHVATSYKQSWSTSSIRLGHAFTEERGFGQTKAGEDDLYYKYEQIRQASLHTANLLVYEMLLDAPDVNMITNEIYDVGENDENADIYTRTSIERMNWACMQKDPIHGTRSLMMRCRDRVKRQNGFANTWAFPEKAKEFISEELKQRNVFIESGKTITDNYDPIKDNVASDLYFTFTPIKIGAHLPDYRVELRRRCIGDFVKLWLDTNESTPETYETNHLDTDIFSMSKDDRVPLRYCELLPYTGYWASDEFLQCDVYKPPSQNNPWPTLNAYGKAFFTDCKFDVTGNKRSDLAPGNWYAWLSDCGLLDFWIKAFNSPNHAVTRDRWTALINLGRRENQVVVGARYDDEDEDEDDDDDDNLPKRNDEDDEEKETGEFNPSKIKQFLKEKNGGKSSMGIDFLLETVGNYEEMFPDSNLSQYLYDTLQHKENRDFLEGAVDMIAWFTVEDYMAHDNLNHCLELPLKGKSMRLPLEEFVLNENNGKFDTRDSSKLNQMEEQDKKGFKLNRSTNYKIYMNPFLVHPTEIEYNTGVFTLTSSRTVLFALNEQYDNNLPMLEEMNQDSNLYRRSTNRIGAFYYSWFLSKVFSLVFDYITQIESRQEPSNDNIVFISQLKNKVNHYKSELPGGVRLGTSFPVLECQKFQFEKIIIQTKELLSLLLDENDNNMNDITECIKAINEQLHAMNNMGVDRNKFEEDYDNYRDLITLPTGPRLKDGKEVPISNDVLRGLTDGEYVGIYPFLARKQTLTLQDIKTLNDRQKVYLALQLGQKFSDSTISSELTMSILRTVPLTLRFLTGTSEVNGTVDIDEQNRFGMLDDKIVFEMIDIFQTKGKVTGTFPKPAPSSSSSFSSSSLSPTVEINRQDRFAIIEGMDKPELNRKKIEKQLEDASLNDVRFFKFMMLEDLPTGLNLIACRPNMGYMAACIVYFARAGQTGKLYYRDIDVLVNEDAATHLRRGSCVMELTPVLLSGANRVRMENVFIDGYLGGQDETVWDLSEDSLDLHEWKSNPFYRSIFIQGRQHKGRAFNAPVINYLGRWEQGHAANDEEEKSSEFPGSAKLCSILGLKNNDQMTTKSRRQIMEHDSETYNHMCFQALQKVYSRNNEGKCKWIAGKGHWGKQEGPGDADWRRGLDTFVPQHGYITGPQTTMITVAH